MESDFYRNWNSELFSKSFLGTLIPLDLSFPDFLSLKQISLCVKARSVCEIEVVRLLCLLKEKKYFSGLGSAK